MMTKQMGVQASTAQTATQPGLTPNRHANRAGIPTVPRSTDADLERDASPPLYRPMIQLGLNQLATEIDLLHQEVQAIAQANCAPSLSTETTQATHPE